MTRILTLFCLLTWTALALEPRPADKGTRLVTDPAARGQEALAVEIGDEAGQHAWPLAEAPLAPGRYRLAATLRPIVPADFDVSRLKLRLIVRAGNRDLAVRDAVRTQFDTGPGVYTHIEEVFDLTQPGRPEWVLAYSIADLPPWMDQQPAHAVNAPTAPKASLETKAAASGDDELDEMTALILADSAIPLSQLRGPALLVDTLDLDPLGPLAVERVWPARVHVYPGEPNPVVVTVRNFTAQPVDTVVRLTLRMGLDEVVWQAESPSRLPAGGTADTRFEWPGGQREFGCEARAEVVRDGQPVAVASEYFSVGAPIWKTAIQGSGFITWYGREDKLAAHVERNRRHYINVEEAFSWQPSSWDDLTPEGDQWWTGQNNYHNSRRGLELWIGASHEQGIKMITYMFATASGPSGAETARRHPETITHQKVGLTSEFHDVEDLRLYEATHERPSLWRYQYGVWQSWSFNRGMFGTMVLAADETIASAREFGWDGVRFDSPPSWSPMGAAGVHADFARYGVTGLMARLIPEYIEQRDGNWDSDAVSVRNMRYLRHRFGEELGDRFAVSSNFGINQEGITPFLRASATDGGQIQQESIRNASSWEWYRDTILTQAELTRQAGGYHCVCALDEAGDLERAYAAILTFAGGSHPYGDWGYRWDLPLPGPYSQFATRYGEYFWDLAWEPVAAEAAGIDVKDPALWWRQFVRRRTLADGSRQTVVHLITPPPGDRLNPKQPSPMQPWRRQVKVTVPGPATVWLLAAEPALRAQALKVADDGSVTVPEHRLWSILAITEAAP